MTTFQEAGRETGTLGGIDAVKPTGGYLSDVLGPSVLAIAALAVAAVTLLAATGRLHRNTLAGIRIPSLYASEHAWMEGHRAAVLPTVVGAVLCVVLAVIVLASPPFSLLGTILEGAVLVISVLTATVLAGHAARR